MRIILQLASAYSFPTTLRFYRAKAFSHTNAQAIAYTSRCSERHVNTKGPGDDSPTALEIADDEGLRGKLAHKVFVVTGVPSGIGVETMRALYATGGHVFGTVRDMKKGQKVVDEIQAKTKGGQITLIEMEMDSLASIKRGATQILFELLKDTLLSSASPAFPSRVVVVASYGHRSAPPRLDDYNFEQPNSYDPWKTYGQAKTANIWFSNEIEIGTCGALDVGGAYENSVVKAYIKSTEQGAATTVYAAISEEWKSKGGIYLSNCEPAAAFSHPDDLMAVDDDGYGPWGYDIENAKKLWEDSLKMGASSRNVI